MSGWRLCSHQTWSNRAGSANLLTKPTGGNDFRIFYERQKAVDWLFKVLFQTIL
jgi:hypothetical protein